MRRAWPARTLRARRRRPSRMRSRRLRGSSGCAGTRWCGPERAVCGSGSGPVTGGSPAAARSCRAAARARAAQLATRRRGRRFCGRAGSHVVGVDQHQLSPLPLLAPTLSGAVFEDVPDRLPLRPGRLIAISVSPRRRTRRPSPSTEEVNTANVRVCLCRPRPPGAGVRTQATTSSLPMPIREHRSTSTSTVGLPAVPGPIQAGPAGPTDQRRCEACTRATVRGAGKAPGVSLSLGFTCTKRERAQPTPPRFSSFEAARGRAMTSQSPSCGPVPGAARPDDLPSVPPTDRDPRPGSRTFDSRPFPCPTADHHLPDRPLTGSGQVLAL